MNDRTPTEHPEPPSDTETYYRDESKRWEDRAYEYAKRLDAAEAERVALQARIEEALAALGGPRRMEDGYISYVITDDDEIRRILSNPSKEES